MSEESFTVELTCLFCCSVLQGSEDAKFRSGDMIPCTHCGESNDYDSVIEVAKEKGIEAVKEALLAQLPSMFKRQ